MAAQPVTKSTPIKSPREFKFAYLVNIAVEKGFSVGTFTRIPRIRSKVSGIESFERPHGMGLADVVEYYTDNQVTDDPKNRSDHFAIVMALHTKQKTFKQLGAIVVSANQNDAAVEKAVMDAIRSGGSESDIEMAILKINEASAAGKAHSSVIASSGHALF